MTKYIFPPEGYTFNTHTVLQDTFIRTIRENGTDQALEWLTTVKKDTERSYPQTLTFCWETDCALSRFELSFDEAFSNPVTVTTDKSSYTADNLLIGQEYFWRVNGGKIHRFRTLPAQPRFIRIDGLLNVRDIGGGRIRQGMVYRGSEMDCFPLTKSGRKTFCEELKIKTDIDLRLRSSAPPEVSPAGQDVALRYLPYRPYREVFEEQHRQGICRIMEVLSDESVYPVYIHCMGGADRTGMIALYLRALLGEEDDILHTDYELTALSTYAAGAAEGATGYRNRNSTYYREFLSRMAEYAPGEPLSVQIYRFLLDCGVPNEQIQKIRSILEVPS